MEVVAAIGGAFLSASLEWLFKKLTSTELLNFGKQKQVRPDLEQWMTLLPKLYAVLEDAEEKQMTNLLIKMWLDELRNLAYDMEDILDEFEFEAQTSKLIGKTQASTSRGLKPRTSSSSKNELVANLDSIQTKIRDMTAKLQRIVAQKKHLNLAENVAYLGHRPIRPPSSSLIEPNVYGRDEDKEAVISLLLNAHNGVSVIPILGMGGVGKTTVAQLVYNDKRVKDQFELRAWVCVSEEFDVAELTKTILQAVTLSKSYFNDFNLLQTNLKQALGGKKFLLVLDDVWNEDYGLWDKLSRPFQAGATGSKIVITTRNHGVASTMSMGKVPAHVLKPLPDEDCLQLFAMHSLETENFKMHPNLKGIAEEIVKKCRGIPLATKVLGGLLRGNLNQKHWENVLKSRIWDLPKEKGGILPALRLSYNHLPPHLKRCFVYCSMFPKDYEFHRDELVLLWMAEGFLKLSNRTKQEEDLGYRCFDDLFSRSFFQQSSANDTMFVVHDLIHDLAQSVAGKLCHHLEDKLEDDQSYATFEETRHLSFTCHHYDISERFKIISRTKSLRTLLALANSPGGCYLSKAVLYDLLPKLTCLRVVSFNGYLIEELPHSVRDLKLLRFIDLSYSLIKSLPDSVCSLVFLQTLILRGCEELTELPQAIGNLVNLFYLDNTDTWLLENMPSGICNLTRLVTFPRFVISKTGGLRVKDLKNLSHLRGQLSILKLHNVLDARDACDANLDKKEGLEVLSLQWIDDFCISRDEKMEWHVLSHLQPHYNLRALSVEFYGGTELPSWLGNPLFQNLNQLELCNCRRTTTLPSLGQLPALKGLVIRGMDAMKVLDVEFHGDGPLSAGNFPSLEKLQFEDMPHWVHWCPPAASQDQCVQIFPLLQELEIKNCPMLNGKLPNHLPSLVKIEITQCPLLIYSSSTTNLPSLQELNIEECGASVLRSMVNLSSLTTLRIKAVWGLASFPLNVIQSAVSLNDVELEDLDSLPDEMMETMHLHKLIVKNCPSLLTFPEGKLPITLKTLKIENCENLRSLPDGITHDYGIDGLSNVPSLEELEVSGCPRLQSFPRGKLPSTLKSLEIRECSNLLSLPEGIMNDDGCDSSNHNMPCLETLEIVDCPCLKSFPGGRLPPMLNILVIRNCGNLWSLPNGIMGGDNRNGSNMLRLERLWLGRLSSLTSFQEGQFPTTLKSLIILGCQQLQSLPETMLESNEALEILQISGCEKLNNLNPLCTNGLTHLIHLNVVGCDSLESFPDTRFSIPNLKSFMVESCKNLRNLPKSIHHLTSLRFLSIKDCPSIEFFPEEGFPPYLLSLEIDCENMKQPISQWGLDRLASLQSFTIFWLCPPDYVLPTSITFLRVVQVEELRSISRGLLKNLTCLEELELQDCPRLKSLAKEGFPQSLGRLLIENCPLLQKRCNNEKGDYWHLIEHIPCVTFGWSEHEGLEGVYLEKENVIQKDIFNFRIE